MILMGSGGFAEELCFWLGSELASQITGYLGKKNEALPFEHLGELDQCATLKGEKLLLAVGLPEIRNKVVSQVLALQGEFTHFIHPSAQVAHNVKIGQGSIIGPFCLISVSAELGDYVLMNNYSSVGHHAKIGDHCVLSPYAAVTGGCVLEKGVFMGVHTSLMPKTHLQSGSKVSPGSSVYKSTLAGDTVVGVPGKVFRI